MWALFPKHWTTLCNESPLSHSAGGGAGGEGGDGKHKKRTDTVGGKEKAGMPTICGSPYQYRQRCEPDHYGYVAGAGHSSEVSMRGPVGCGLPLRGSSVIPHCTYA